MVRAVEGFGPVSLRESVVHRNMQATEGEIARNLSGTRNRKPGRQLWKVGGNSAPKV
ncbi:hypothetical protein FHW17_004874 [Phyllobacterium sp. P30BS-XVII]|nr:hypothetical protein [Phyllobacterium sp. P30BS-XVII]